MTPSTKDNNVTMTKAFNLAAKINQTNQNMYFAVDEKIEKNEDNSRTINVNALI